MNKIVFQPMGIIASINKDETILHAAQRAGVHIEAYCGSKKICGKCRVKISEGYFGGYGINSLGTNVSPITDAEKKILSIKDIENNYRLACATTVNSDVVIEIPKESRTSEEVILETGKEKDIQLKPAVKVYYLELDKPTLEDNRDDYSRIKEALIKNYEELKNNELLIDYDVLKQMPNILRKSNWKISITILYNKKIIRIEKGNINNLYGVAIDIGTTTIAAYLCSLNDGKIKQSASMMNPQIRYGDDVLTRVSHCTSTNGGVEQLQKILIDGLNELIDEMKGKENICSNEISEAVMVFNTVMQHIALGISPDFIGVSPFVSGVAEPLDIVARELGLNIIQSGNVHCLPSEAGFIGADNVAVLIAEEPYLQEKMKLIIDIGTNSEICLGNKDKLYCTSCATGPALEGAQIKCGMRAAKGAIEAVRINPYTLEPELKIIGLEKNATPVGICGSGILDVIAQMAITGIIEPDGKISKIANSNRIRLGEDGKKEYVLYFAKNENERDIVVTQKDVRAVQLAKAALYAGAKALMNRSEIEEIDEIILAGAFGSYIDKKNALELGLFPDCNLDNVTVVGNAAGLGARLALLNIDKRKEAKEIARNVEFIETATNVDYQMMFAKAMTIPHERDCFSINKSYKWPCSGNDNRFISDEICEYDIKPLEDIELMEKAILNNKEIHNASYLTFPLMQKIEAVTFGGIPKLVGNSYVISDYLFNSLEEINFNLSIMQNKVVLDTLECISRHSEENIVLEVSAPFSILATLINPTKLYSYRSKNKELIIEVLNKIVNSLSEYTIEAIDRGVNIISFADSEGVIEMVGEKFFKEISGISSYQYLKKIESHLNKALVHICGKTSTSLEKAGFMTAKSYRVEDKEYIDVLLDCVKNKKIKFVGHSCIHTKKLVIPIIKKLDLTLKS